MIKKLLVLLLASVMLVSLIPGVAFAKVAEFDWKAYDELIAKIKVATDFDEREAMMHEAEDILMDTGAICPIYHYNDVFMAKKDLTGYYFNNYGFKFFQFAEMGDATTLRLNISSEPNALDPALNSSVDGAILAVNSFSGLMTYDADGKVAGDLAESYEVSEDGLVYTFTLRDDLKWSDGDKLDASDLEYSWKRAVDPSTAADYSYMFDVIEGYPKAKEEGEEETPFVNTLAVTASEDGKVLEVKLHSPCAYFIDLCAFPTYFPVKKDFVEAAEGFKDGDDIVNPGAWAVEAGFPSNGPFKLTDWAHSESMVYEKNPHYHRADEVKFERLEFMLSDDEAVIYSAYQADDLDFIDRIPVEETGRLVESKDEEFHIVDLLGTYYVIFNVKSELFAGKTAEEATAMRQAIAYLIDRAYIVDTVAQANQTLANTFIPPNMLDGQNSVFKQNDEAYTYRNEEEVGYYGFEPDYEKATELLEAAGFKFEGDVLSSETPFHINYLTNKSDAHQAIAECIQQDLAMVGITMDITQMDWNTTLDERKAGNFDVARHGWIADFNDPINMLEMWTTDSGNNDAQFGR